MVLQEPTNPRKVAHEDFRHLIARVIPIWEGEHSSLDGSHRPSLCGIPPHGLILREYDPAPRPNLRNPNLIGRALLEMIPVILDDQTYLP